MTHESRFWPAPLCDDCWDKFAPDHPSPRLGCGETETCDDCGQLTNSGIYVRRERKPETPLRQIPERQ